MLKYIFFNFDYRNDITIFTSPAFLHYLWTTGHIHTGELADTSQVRFQTTIDELRDETGNTFQQSMKTLLFIQYKCAHALEVLTTIRYIN